jgi:hypothetical protein
MHDWHSKPLGPKPEATKRTRSVYNWRPIPLLQLQSAVAIVYPSNFKHRFSPFEAATCKEYLQVQNAGLSRLSRYDLQDVRRNALFLSITIDHLKTF